MTPKKSWCWRCKEAAIIQYSFGGIYWKRQDYPKAVEALETYLRLTPNAHDAERVRALLRTSAVHSPIIG